MTKISKTSSPRDQVTLTGDEAEIIAYLKPLIEKKLGFSISKSKVIRIALNKLVETEFQREVISSHERTITPGSK